MVENQQTKQQQNTAMREQAEITQFDRRKQWLHLSPNLIAALEQLASSDGVSLEALLISLINEALAYRLNNRKV